MRCFATLRRHRAPASAITAGPLTSSLSSPTSRSCSSGARTHSRHAGDKPAMARIRLYRTDRPRGLLFEAAQHRAVQEGAVGVGDVAGRVAHIEVGDLDQMPDPSLHQRVVDLNRPTSGAAGGEQPLHADIVFGFTGLLAGGEIAFAVL